MPELPEVETVRLGLKKYIEGHKIIDVDIRTPKVFQGSKEYLVGARVENVRRFAKVLSIDLSNDNSVAIHVKLTGQLIYRGPNLKEKINLSRKVIGGIPGPHTHVIFKFDRGGTLYYNDVRKFGWVKILRTNEVKNLKFISKLGPEPFVDLTFPKFKEILLKNKTAIKALLMNQEKIGGVGNIYANDSLWLSQIHPKKPANTLSPTQQEKLYDAILSVLKKGVQTGGASELAFVTVEGKEGNYQNHFLSYGQQGKLCPRCRKERFEKFMLGGRGTYICPACQIL